MKKHAESHLDHNLTEAQIEFLMKRYAERSQFFVDTVELPPELGTVPCGLFGPVMGDAPIVEAEVVYARRGKRTWDSRLVARAPRLTRMVSVIAGPHEEACGPSHWPKQCVRCQGELVIKHACILYTAFGGPIAPQEPGDPGCRNVDDSTRFWRDHALSQD